MKTLIKICFFLTLNAAFFQAKAQDALKIEENGNVIVTQNLDVKGKIQQNGNDLLPSGAIIMWYGGTTAPTGWVMCDGKKHKTSDNKEIETPDLSDRFIVGAGSRYPLKSTGGKESVTLTEDQIPAHKHKIDFTTPKEEGSHPTMIDVRRYDTACDYDNESNFLPLVCSPTANTKKMTIKSPAYTDTYHTHSVKGDTNTTGGGKPHENIPPYYALYYIMKL